MAKIITLAHQKGGVGKSTLALNLALCFKDQLRVALIDSDLQGSIYHLKEDFPELAILAPEKLAELPDLDYDLIFVDTPPYLSNRLNELFSYSDFILVPTKAGFFDVMAVKSTLALVKFAQAQNQKLKAGIVLNMIKPRSGITIEVVSLLSSLGTPLLKTRVFDRVSLARSSMTSGILKSADQKAIEEVTFLAEEIINLLSE
ncbi:chromosome partitioning protein [Mucilaginibacter gossypiicola]|uniref:Chromosome partitioning protein n=1 Tax=Mucilaginibacter gossypiicola TaxID=551995 RepID=A0A1H8U886_9SPHI|nr:ParA family protein [Mucilaginibacter gossypiicola]SEO98868.1 chromosome partitioning protein [Mucilaginibacter gossypiicola]